MTLSILVLGASGTLGSSIAHYLCEQDFKVIGQCNRNPINFVSKNLTILQANINQIDILNLKPNVVINCIGCKKISPELFTLNTSYPLKLIKDCEAAGVKRFIHVSSVGTIGANFKAGVVDESCSLSPSNAYEISKAAADQAILSIPKSNMEVLIIMPSNIVTYKSSCKDMAFLRRFSRAGILVSIKGRSSVLNFVFDIHISEYIKDVISSSERIVGKRILNTPIPIEFLVESFRKSGKKILLLRISEKSISRIRSFLSAVFIFLPFAILEKLINKTYEIDNDRIFQTSDSFTRQRFDTDQRRLDFVEYLK